MAKAEARPERVKPESSKEGKDKAKGHLVQRDGKFNAVLHRDSEYHDNARPVLEAACKGGKMYDDVKQIEKGVKRQSTVRKADPKDRPSMIAKRVPKYTFNYKNTEPKCYKGEKNFTGEPFQGKPYGYQAHHILVCELFYDKKWEAQHLQILKLVVNLSLSVPGLDS